MATQDKPKLTQRVADGAAAIGKKYWLHDHQVQRMKLRVTKAGAKAWVIIYRKPNGGQGEMRLGSWEAMTIEMARVEARKKLAELDTGTDPLEAKQAIRDAAKARLGRTLGGVWEAFKKTPAYTTKRDSTRSGYETSFRVHILPRIGSLPVDDIGTRQIANLRDTLLAEASGSVSNAAKRALSVVLGYAVEQELVPFNAAKSVPNVYVDRRRDRILSGEELQELWQTIKNMDGMGETVAGILRVCMFLPARVGEVAGMLWSEVDLEARLWTISGARMKNHKDHELPLSDSVVAFLSDLRATSELSLIHI